MSKRSGRKLYSTGFASSRRFRGKCRSYHAVKDLYQGTASTVPAATQNPNRLYALPLAGTAAEADSP